ncbi:cysteine--tRNA ligase [Candidatus Gracilibacteria bacterium]|nr:cysteine--tRNA ligase [Candidatus Gracilibacteria bacterium]
MLQIYNTKTRSKEEFKPRKQEEVKIYYCGPTVYNYAHIGNLRTYVFEDIVVKTLRFLGYPVKTVMNVTDIDDKTIKASVAAGESLDTFTQKYTEIFLSDIERIGIQPADIISPISGVIPEMIRMIQTMLNRKNAYLAEDGSVYFDISSFKNYGKLAHLDMSGMKSSVRIDNDEYEKESASDFALWKGYKPEDGDNVWEAEFVIDGEKKVIKGRPGWHIECSACNMKHFGQQIDIHMGGIDNLFPHHQNEVAQTESCTKKEFSKYWLHAGHLTVDGKKMAKSANNFYTLNDIAEKYTHTDSGLLFRAVRLVLMNGKYKDSVDFTFEKLDHAITTIKKIDDTTKRLKRYMAETEFEAEGIRREFSDTLQEYIQGYIEKLEDDFNIPEALSVFFQFQSVIHTQLDSLELSLEESQACLDLLSTFHQVLGIVDTNISAQDAIPADIQDLFEQRMQAKAEKDFETSDRVRDELSEKGYKIVDEKSGSRIEKI